MNFFVFFILLSSQVFSRTVDHSAAYDFLKKKSQENKPEIIFNQYEDIISGSLAFVLGNIGYFTTDSSTLKISYSGVQTIGIISVGHGIYDYYYPHFESRLLELLKKKNMTRGNLADGYLSLLGEMERAKRISLLWSSSLLTMQYFLNAFVSEDIPRDVKDIYLFLGGVNAIVATYSYFYKSDYEKYYLQSHQTNSQVSMMILPDLNGGTRAGIALTKRW